MCKLHLAGMPVELKDTNMSKRAQQKSQLMGGSQVGYFQAWPRNWLRKKLQLFTMVRTELNNPATSGLQVQCPDYSASMLR